MGTHQSRIKISMTAMLLMIAIVFAFAQVAIAQPDVGIDSGQNEDGTVEAFPINDSCRIQIRIQGDGSIAGLDNNGVNQRLAAANNELLARCGDTIELSAIPEAGWRFVTWQGVPESVQLKSTIVVESPAQVTAVFAQQELLRYESLEVPYVDRGGQLVTEIPIYESAWRDTLDVGEVNAVPIIDVWYGDNQPFGQKGIPQNWVNVLGNVSDPDGTLPQLEYSLNGDTPVTLKVGGDTTDRGYRLRLYRDGDFNIDIDYADLDDGENSVVITATDTLSATTSLVTIDYDAGIVWPLPYSIDWENANSIHNVAQVVDGDWDLKPAGVRPKPDKTGYDRIIALGDVTWTDFELTVPVTVHGYDPNGFGGKQVAPAIGVVMRWEGHTMTPNLCDQPLCGYLPVGATSWYAFESPTSEDGQFSMWATPNAKTFDPTNLTLTWGETYYWKVRSETIPGTKGKFKMKVWPVGEQEPADWLVTMDGNSNSLQNGSALLLSHHVDLTFGDVTVVPITAGEGPPDISNVQVVPEPYGATVRWLTDEPATSQVDYGLSSAYGGLVQSADLVTEHSMYLPGLDQQMEYHFQITSKDATNESASTDDDTFETQELISLVSDDFNTCTLDPDWEFVNPLEDGSYDLNGNQATISVPADVNHDIWPDPDLEPTNRAPRLMRAVTDPNNLKVKFDSGTDAEIEQQGIIVEQDENNFLRMNYQYKKGRVELVVVGFKSGSGPESIRTINLNGNGLDGPLYLLLTRMDGQWQLGYSFDDENWSAVGAFSFPLSVTKAGVYAGNAGALPAYTAEIDYYFDAAAPIDPEDADNLILPVTVVGEGSVSKDPTCGNPVTLTAKADPGWHFVEWQGSPVDGLTALQVIAMFDHGDEVTALFEIGEPERYTLAVQTNGQGTAIPDPEKSEYDAGEVVKLTAEPADDWLFDSWGGALSDTNPVQTLVMDSDKIVTANFIQSQFEIDITIDGPGQVQKTPQGPYDHGEEVMLTATPSVGSLTSFAGWSGDITSTDNPLIINLTEDVALTATFVGYQSFLPITVSPPGT